MLQLIWSAFPPGRRQKGNSLDEVAKRTLGEGKDGEAIMAPQLYENGMFATLFDYCLQDVALTRRLFLFAQEHGGIIGPMAICSPFHSRVVRGSGNLNGQLYSPKGIRWLRLPRPDHSNGP